MYALLYTNNIKKQGNRQGIFQNSVFEDCIPWFANNGTEKKIRIFLFLSTKKNDENNFQKMATPRESYSNVAESV